MTAQPSKEISRSINGNTATICTTEQSADGTIRYVRTVEVDGLVASFSVFRTIAGYMEAFAASIGARPMTFKRPAKGR